jgi:hypothetical protein
MTELHILARLAAALLSLPALIGHPLQPLLHPEFRSMLSKKGAHAPRDPHVSIPAIARLLGVRVGYNGQEALERQFGSGLAVTGGHPGGRKLWKTHHPSGSVETDGFSYNHEGLVLETLSWTLGTIGDPKIPSVRRLPRHAGWLGMVYPGMTQAQVSELTAHRLPAPRKAGNVWTWKATGFVRPNRNNEDVYTTWTAKLTFGRQHLISIDLECDGDLLPPPSR